MFPIYTLQPDSKETEVGSRDQEAFSIAAEFTGVVLIPCHAQKHVSTTTSGDVYISKVPRSHLLQQISSQ